MFLRPLLPPTPSSSQRCTTGAKHLRFACFSHSLYCLFHWKWNILFARVAKRCISNSSCIEWVRLTYFFLFACVSLGRETVLLLFSPYNFFSSVFTGCINLSFLPCLAILPCPCLFIRLFRVAFGPRIDWNSCRRFFSSSPALFLWPQPNYLGVERSTAAVEATSQSTQRSTFDILFECDNLNDSESSIFASFSLTFAHCEVHDRVHLEPSILASTSEMYLV